MAGYSELIKNFEKIRDFTRDFFVYGFKSRNDYTKLSPRTYDNERRRIESYLSGLVIKNQDQRGRTLSISSNTTAKTSNPLFKVWETKSFTRNDCFLHFVILDILSLHKSLSVTEITEIISKDYVSEVNSGEPIDTMTIRNKLNEYSKLGILETFKQGKALYYKKTPNPLDNLSSETKQALEQSLSFYKNILPAGFIGHSIDDLTDSPFIYRQIFFSQILDDDILLQLLSAIDHKQTVSAEIAGSRHNINRNTRFLPLKILINTKTGRRYVAIYSLRNNKYSTIRLDYIKKIAPDGIHENFDAVSEEYKTLMTHSFSITHQNPNKLHYVKMLLCIDENSEQYVLERIQREGKHGIIHRVEENLFEYHIELTDTMEIVPWLRTFIGRIVELEGSESHIITQFKRDISAMAALYPDQNTNFLSE